MKRKPEPIISTSASAMIVSVVACLLLSLFCNAFLWSHIDRAMTETPWFIVPARAGLLFVDLVLLAFTIVELFAHKIAGDNDDSNGDNEADAIRLRKIMAIWVFILTTMAAIHAANLFVQSSARADQRDEVNILVDAANKLNADAAKEVGEQYRKSAEAAQARGQRSTAAQILRKEIKIDTSGALKSVKDIATQPTEGFLPDWYAKRYSFVVLLLSGVLALSIGGASVFRALETARRARMASAAGEFDQVTHVDTTATQKPQTPGKSWRPW